MKMKWTPEQNEERNSTEIIIGTEDCAFHVEGEWFWQSRGSASVHGPFPSLAAASEDYHSS